LGNHVTENSADRIKPLVSMANVSQPCVVKQNLLYDEDCHCLAQFRARLHNAQA